MTADKLREKFRKQLLGALIEDFTGDPDPKEPAAELDSNGRSFSCVVTKKGVVKIAELFFEEPDPEEDPNGDADYPVNRVVPFCKFQIKLEEMADDRT